MVAAGMAAVAGAEQLWKQTGSSSSGATAFEGDWETKKSWLAYRPRKQCIVSESLQFSKRNDEQEWQRCSD